MFHTIHHHPVPSVTHMTPHTSLLSHMCPHRTADGSGSVDELYADDTIVRCLEGESGM